MGFIVNINVLTVANYNVMYGYESYRNSGRYASSLSVNMKHAHTTVNYFYCFPGERGQ